MTRAYMMFFLSENPDEYLVKNRFQPKSTSCLFLILNT
jgi:hypothetical protein